MSCRSPLPRVSASLDVLTTSRGGSWFDVGGARNNESYKTINFFCLFLNSNWWGTFRFTNQIINQKVRAKTFFIYVLFGSSIQRLIGKIFRIFFLIFFCCKNSIVLQLKSVNEMYKALSVKQHSETKHC